MPAAFVRYWGMTEAKPYDDIIFDHIKNARNYLALNDANRRASGSNPLCGDDLTVYLKVESARLQEVSFLCTCCGISMASASIMTEIVRGKTAADALGLIRAFVALLAASSEAGTAHCTPDQRAVVDAVRRYPSRVRCAVLPWVTLQAALEGRAEASA